MLKHSLGPALGILLALLIGGCSPSSSEDLKDTPAASQERTQDPQPEEPQEPAKEPAANISPLPEFPETIGGITVFSSVCEQQADAQGCLASELKQREVTAANVKDLSDAYGGPAAGEYYSTGNAEILTNAYVVRGNSPDLWLTRGSQAAADFDNREIPSQWVETRGDAQCILHSTGIVPKGEEIPAGNTKSHKCQASGNGLTVMLYLKADQDDALDWTQELFDHFQSGATEGATPAEQGSQSTQQDMDLPELPNQIGSLGEQLATCKRTFPSALDNCLEKAAERQPILDAAVAELSAAYGGAQANGKNYATEDFQHFAGAYTFIGQTPGLWLPDGNAAAAERLNLELPRRWVETREDIQCVVFTLSTIEKSAKYNEEDFMVSNCQASINGKTIFFETNAPRDRAFNWMRLLVDQVK